VIFSFEVQEEEEEEEEELVWLKARLSRRSLLQV
jgi:hypothetical protein